MSDSSFSDPVTCDKCGNAISPLSRTYGIVGTTVNSVTMKYAQINRLVHRDMRPKVVHDGSVVDVVYGDGNTLRLPNRQWSYNNPVLQFYALYGIKPSDYGGTVYELQDKYLPLQLTENGYVVDTETMLQGGETALEKAEWFDPDIDVESGEEGNSGVFGGGSPDPGTGNQGAVDHESIMYSIDMSDGSLQVEVSQ